MAAATLTTVGIVNARGTDQYALIYAYSDGSESGPSGSYQTVDSAMRAAVGLGADAPEEFLAREIEGATFAVEDWTSESDE